MDSDESGGQRLLSDERKRVHTIPRKPVARARPSYDSLGISGQRIRQSPDQAWDQEQERHRELYDGGRTYDIEPTARTRKATHQSVESVQESLLKSTATVSINSESESKEGQQRTASWRPKWLRPGVLGSFAGLFLFFTIALATMLWYSQTNQGLFETMQSPVHVYLWRFGPTAILTILTILWSRVELQAMMYMPWIALNRGHSHGKDGMVLDYTSMLSPVVLVRSFREKHYLVFLVAVLSLILRAQIILAPSLYSLATVKIVTSVNITLHDTFSLVGNDSLRDTSPYYVSRAIHDFDMMYPYGVTKDLAYQTFNASSGNTRGTIDEPVTAIVDALFTEVHCLDLETYTITAQNDTRGMSPTRLQVYVDLQFEGCDRSISITPHLIYDVAKGESAWVATENLTPDRPCPNLPQDIMQFLYYGAKYRQSAANSSLVEFETAAAVLCAPRAWVSKVEVTDDGINPNVTLLPNQIETPVTANIWTMANNSIPSSLGQWGVPKNSYVYGAVETDRLFRGEESDLPDAELFQNDLLYNSVKNVTKFLGPFIGHYRLRQSESSTGVGTMLKSTDRLIVNYWVCSSMTALFALITCLAAFTLCRYSRHTAVWYRDPATILGNMMFLRDHPDFANRAADSTFADAVWNQCTFTPLVLRTWARLSSVIFTICLMGGLVLTLQISTSSGGLATIQDEGYLHVLWTSFPAVVALGVALYVSSCDWAYRDLATLYHLSMVPCDTRLLDSSLLDMLGLRVLYHSVRQRLWSVTLAQFLALICGLLTSIVSVLFTVEAIPASAAVNLKQTTWFKVRDNVEYDKAYGTKQTSLSGLLLRLREINYTYPANTYDDLIFHGFESTENLDTSRNLSVRATIPAARLQPSCSQIPENRFSRTFRNYTESEGWWFYTSIIEPFTCPNSNLSVNLTHEFALGKAKTLGYAYFADLVQTPHDPNSLYTLCDVNDTSIMNYTTTRYETYAWGNYSVEKDDLEYLSVWRCNYTWVEFATEVDMVVADGKLEIDPQNPPRPILSTTRPLNPPLDVPPASASLKQGADLGDLFPEANIDDPLGYGVRDRFRALLEPYGQLPLEVFGDPERDADILKQLDHYWAFSAAQLANTENRIAVGEGTTSSSSLASGTPLTVDGILTDRSRRRLVQNPNLTYALLAILGAVVVVNTWALVSVAVRRRGGESWLLDMDVRGLAPNGFRSIGSMAGLLRNSNAAAHLPPNTELLPSKELHGLMADHQYRLGWFRREWDQTRHFTVGVMGDGGFNFMGIRKVVRKEWVGTTPQENKVEGGWI